MSSGPSIRKAAILVSLLDSDSADALLEPMGDELAAQVRQAVMDLDDVSQAEEEQVLAEFFGRSAASEPEDSGVEMELSTVALASNPQPEQPAPTFAFLDDVPPEAIADALSPEHPQTIAVVVAHLAPELAGQVLQCLNPSLATEALARMARLTIPLPEILADLAGELRRRLAPYAHASSSPASLAGVQAILDSISGPSRAQLIDRLAERDRHLASRLGASSLSSQTRSAPPNEVFSFKYRLESNPRSNQSSRIPAGDSPPLVEFEDLLLLKDRELALLGAAASSQQLAMALLDADQRLTQRLLAGIPAGVAAQVRSRLSQPGPLRLQEIDEAQRQLADLARELASRGEISLPRSRHFAAAA